MYVDCNHFCHRLFLSPWCELFDDVLQRLGKHVSPREKVSVCFYHNLFLIHNDWYVLVKLAGAADENNNNATDKS